MTFLQQVRQNIQARQLPLMTFFPSCWLMYAVPPLPAASATSGGLFI